MASLTSLASREENTGLDGDGDKGPALHQRTRIGRLDLELVEPHRAFTCSWKRTSSIHDASYALVFPLTGCVAFSQDGRVGIARAGEYVLLSELAFYELSSDKTARFLVLRIPAAELRGRLVVDRGSHQPTLQAKRTDDPPSGRNDRKRGRAVHRASGANPQALATEVISFVALTIGSEDRGAATDVRNARYHLRRRIC